MKISIITVCYNAEATIEQTIQSVVRQTYQSIEYIVVDGASSDGTIKIVNSYSDAITTFVTGKDAGIYDAMNKGIALATGDVIGILNADDLYASDEVVSDVMRCFTTDTSVKAVYGDLYYFRNDETEKSVRFWKSVKYYTGFFHDGFVIPHPTLFVKKELYKKIGVYHSLFRISSDYEFMLRAFVKGGYTPYYLPQTLVKMRTGGESTSSIKNVAIGNREIIESWRMNQLKMPVGFFPRRTLYKLRQLVKK